MTGSDESAVVFLPTIFMSLSYVLWAVLMLWLSGLLVRRRPSWQVWLMPGVLVVAGFLVRIAAMQGGPGDLRINIADAVTTRIALGGWGSAPVAFFRMVGWFVPLSGVSIMLVNALLAALVPALVYLLVLELRCSRVAALASAVLTVIYPVLMVFARVINRQPTYLWLSFLALYFLARFLRRQEWPDLVPVAIAAILAAWSRPEGAVILVPLMVLALFQARTMKLRVVLVGAGGILCIGAWLYVSLPVFGGLYDSSASIDWFNAIRIWPRVLLFDPDFTPLAQTLVWIAGLVWGFRYRPRLAATAVLTVLLLVAAWVVTDVDKHFIDYHLQIASARYQTLLAFPLALGTALAIDGVARLSPAWRLMTSGAMAVLYVVTYVLPAERVLTPRTIDLEYDFLSRELTGLPPLSHIYYVLPEINDMGFLDLQELAVLNGRRDFSWHLVSAPPEDYPAGPKSYLYSGSLCAPRVLVSHHPASAEVQERHLELCRNWSQYARKQGRVIAETRVPARKLAWLEFARAEVLLELVALPIGESSLALGTGQIRVLPPGLENDIMASFESLQPEWIFDTASIRESSISARFCQPDNGSCVEVVLADPEPHCDGTQAGPWCVLFQDGQAPDGFHDSLISALDSWQQRTVWKSVSTGHIKGFIPARSGPP